jgi:hypothetical protein
MIHIFVDNCVDTPSLTAYINFSYVLDIFCNVIYGFEQTTINCRIMQQIFVLVCTSQLRQRKFNSIFMVVTVLC